MRICSYCALERCIFSKNSLNSLPIARWFASVGSWPRSPLGLPCSFESFTRPGLYSNPVLSLYRIASHIPVLHAIYTSIHGENISPLTTLRIRCGAKSPTLANQRAIMKGAVVVVLKACSGVFRAVPGCSLAGTVIRRDTNYRATMAGIVPNNPLHFLHPWRSDG